MLCLKTLYDAIESNLPTTTGFMKSMHITGRLHHLGTAFGGLVYCKHSIRRPTPQRSLSNDCPFVESCDSVINGYTPVSHTPRCFSFIFYFSRPQPLFFKAFEKNLASIFVCAL